MASCSVRAGLLAAALLLVPAALPAQEPAEPAAPRGVEARVTLWQLIRAGGWTMLPLGLCSVAVLALVIRNLMVLRADKLLRPDLLPELLQAMAARDVGAARDLCAAHPSLLGAVVDSALERITGETADPEGLKEAVEEAGTEQMMNYMGSVTYLSVIGAVAPMLGLLGTVSGMIKAFRNISLGGMGKPEMLASNIGEALITTAAGLVIAIPAMLFYFYFKHDFMRTMARLGRMTGQALDAFRNGAAPAGAGA